MTDTSSNLPFIEPPASPPPPPPPYDCPDGECHGKCEEYRERVARGEAVTTNSDLHRARNVCNYCPRTPPEPVIEEGSIYNSVTHYEDHQGNVWHADNAASAWWYHNDPFPGFRDNDNMTFRAGDNEPTAGSQCTYRNGELDDTTGTMGTFDYGPAGTTDHINVDVTPHDANVGYIPNLTTQY